VKPRRAADGGGAADADDLTHTTDEGDVQMVDVGDKPDSERRAVAVGEIRLQPSTVEAIRADGIGKGDVLATARVGAIQAVKHTWETIPMCHQIPITNVDTDFSLAEDRIELRVAVETTGETGCEMEARGRHDRPQRRLGHGESRREGRRRAVPRYGYRERARAREGERTSVSGSCDCRDNADDTAVKLPYPTSLGLTTSLVEGRAFAWTPVLCHRLW